MSEAVFTGDVHLSLKKRRVFRTLVTNFESGKEQRRSKWSRPKHTFKWKNKGLSVSEADYIYDFFNTRQGKGESFYWEITDESPTSQSGDELIGTGNGSTSIYNFSRYPVKSGDCTLTVAGAAQTEGTDYTVTYPTGAISFLSPVASGEAIVSSSYRFYYNVRFSNDYVDKEQFAYQLYKFGIDLTEVI